jgi:hypothetical protein
MESFPGDPILTRLQDGILNLLLHFSVTYLFTALGHSKPEFSEMISDLSTLNWRSAVTL